MPAVPGRRRHTTRAGNPVLDPPPPSPGPIRPRHIVLEPGQPLLRTYSPEPYATDALTFRRHGPHSRFDHHRPDADGAARLDPDRGIAYAGGDLTCCLGELFADSQEITTDGTKVAVLSVTDPISLLDLRGTAATGVGITQAIAAISQRKTSQAWGRYLYEHPELADMQGLIYTASNSGLDAIALFERAEGRLTVAVDLDLGDDAVDDELQLAADDLHWPITR